MGRNLELQSNNSAFTINLETSERCHLPAFLHVLHSEALVVRRAGAIPTAVGGALLVLAVQQRKLLALTAVAAQASRLTLDVIYEFDIREMMARARTKKLRQGSGFFLGRLLTRCRM